MKRYRSVIGKKSQFNFGHFLMWPGHLARFIAFCDSKLLIVEMYVYFNYIHDTSIVA